MNKDQCRSIGLFDSGLGGLTVLRELKKIAPKEWYVYLGDNARTPYGPKSEKVITRYSFECADFLLKKGVKLIVVACNTVSSLVLSQLEQRVSCPVVGTIAPAVKVALEASKNGTIAVLGTQATISSGAYRKALENKDSNLKIIEKACPLFVPLVENGMFEGQIVDLTIDYYLNEIKESGADVVILGCTHYPLLIGPLRRYFGEKIALVECSRAIALEVEQLFHSGSLAHSEISGSEYYTTDEVGRFDHLASYFLDDKAVQSVKIGLS